MQHWICAWQAVNTLILHQYASDQKVNKLCAVLLGEKKANIWGENSFNQLIMLSYKNGNDSQKENKSIFRNEATTLQLRHLRHKKLFYDTHLLLADNKWHQ